MFIISIAASVAWEPPGIEDRAYCALQGPPDARAAAAAAADPGRRPSSVIWQERLQDDDAARA